MVEPIDNKSTESAGLSQTRLIVLIVIVTILGSVLGTSFINLKFGAGFALGGVLSLVNFFWMRRSLSEVFGSAQEGEKPFFAGGGYFMRYVALATVLGFVYLIDWDLLIAVLFGLGSFAFAVVIEGFIRIAVIVFK